MFGEDGTAVDHAEQVGAEDPVPAFRVAVRDPEHLHDRGIVDPDVYSAVPGDDGIREFADPALVLYIHRIVRR
ncbi:hypothetical protein GCM10018790_12470 [Kitasatospora xanthocidica]|nr:hypothetical protein GCM10018790_12470 [Kitasatospora xanthocidica]